MPFESLMLMGALFVLQGPDQEAESGSAIVRKDPIQLAQAQVEKAPLDPDATARVLELLKEIREGQQRDRDEFDARLKALEARPVPQLERSAAAIPQPVIRAKPTGKPFSGWRVDVFKEWQVPNDGRPARTRLLEPDKPAIRTVFVENTEFDGLLGSPDKRGGYIVELRSNFIPRKSGIYLLAVRTFCGTASGTNRCDMKFDLGGQTAMRLAEGNNQGEYFTTTYEAKDLNPISVRLVMGPSGGINWVPTAFRYYPLVKGPDDNEFRDFEADELVHFRQ